MQVPYQIREAHNVTGHSTVNNGRSIKDITPSSSSRFLTEGYSSDESEGSSRTSFLISSCSSPYKTMLSPSWGNENGSELSALSPASGYSKSPLASPLMQPSLMLPSSVSNISALHALLMDLGVLWYVQKFHLWGIYIYIYVMEHVDVLICELKLIGI